jgi:hypothetical protein
MLETQYSFREALVSDLRSFVQLEPMLCGKFGFTLGNACTAEGPYLILPTIP